MKRTFDIILAAVLLILFAFPMLCIMVMIKLFSQGPFFHWSNRVGKQNVIFSMPKFRTMRVDTPQLPTHLLADSQNWITPIGNFLRKTSLDELPQLWSILKGDMSFVGPRPALFNQDDLVQMRTESKVHELVPGLTGWAQVNGRDELSIPQKVEFDLYYLNNQGMWLDLKIMMLTLLKVVRRDDVAQAGEEGHSKDT